mgnify:CR=1 FL=1
MVVGMRKRTYEASEAAKREICAALKTLMAQKPLNKITVAEIMQSCGMARQHFYYHFEDIPALFRWMLESNVQHSLLEAQAASGGEERLRSLFVMAINSMPYVKKSMESNYREDGERFIGQYLQNLFQQVCDEEGLYQNCTRFQVRLILRYHSQAMLGLFRNWTEEDTKNLDQIVHTVFRLMTEGIPPTEGE